MKITITNTSMNCEEFTIGDLLYASKILELKAELLILKNLKKEKTIKKSRHTSGDQQLSEAGK